MTHLFSLRIPGALLLCFLTVLQTSALVSRDISRQKTRSTLTMYEHLQRHIALRKLREKSCTSLADVTACCKKIQSKLAAHEAQRTLHANVRSNRVYDFRLSDIHELVEQALANPESFLTV
mgnify:FL=1